MNGLDRIRELINDAADLWVMSLLVAAGLIAFLPGVQRHWTYAAAGVVMATLLGLAARRFGMPDGTEILAVMVGFIAGPTTAARLQGKTIFEAIDEIRAARRPGDNDG